MSESYLHISKTTTHELLSILNNNVIGTPGQGMLYQHLGVANKIDLITDPYYVNLVRNNKIAGTCCFCKRTTFHQGHPALSFYVRYFSFLDLFRRKSVSKKSVSHKSKLREEVALLLDGNRLEVDANEKFYHYAYVDPRNSRSALLCDEFGFEPVREFTTIIFNRLRPKENKNRKIEAITTGDESIIKKLLTDFYHHYTMFSWENLFSPRTYYVIKDEQGVITGGLQVNPDRWKILSLPGNNGKLILNAFTRIPYLNRLFSTTYQFLTIEGVYYKAGAEKDLEILLETLLHRYQVYSAILPVDANTELYRTLKSLDLGLTNKMSKEVRGNVIARFTRFSDAEVAQFKENPTYISGIDVT